MGNALVPEPTNLNACPLLGERSQRARRVWGPGWLDYPRGGKVSLLSGWVRDQKRGVGSGDRTGGAGGRMRVKKGMRGVGNSDW